MLLLNFFKRKIRFFRFPLPSFGHLFPCHRDNFHVFSRPGKEIFLPVLSFSHFFRDFPAGKSAFSGMNFPSDRIFSPFSGSIFRSIRQEFSPFRLIFARTRRARTCTRVIIYWVPFPATFSFFRKTCRKTYLKHSHLWIFLQKVWKKVFVKVGGSEKVRNFAPAFERERRWRNDNLKGNGAGSSGSAAVQVSYLNGVKGARTAAGRSQLPPPKKLFEKNFRKSLAVSKKAPNFANAFDNKRKPRKRNSSLKDFR